MGEDRSRYGLLAAALGAVLLAISVFLPWYAVRLTPAGVTVVQHTADEVIARYGNAALQGLAGPLHAGVGALAGQQVASLTGREATGGVTTVLLILAALALLDALLPLVRSGPVPAGGGAALLLLGLVAGGCVLFRLFVAPAPAGELLALSPRVGAWLALLGAAMVTAGGAWPRRAAAAPAPESRLDGAFARLSGWTPQG